MKLLTYLHIAILFAIFVTQPAWSQAYKSVQMDKVTVCSASDADTKPPLASASNCETGNAWSADPQNDHIWAIFDLNLDEETIDAIKPASLVVSAKASSHIFLNGEFVAANGSPSNSASSETPGRMDFITPLEPGALNVGHNTIALRLSSHNGFLKLNAPIHGVFVTPYDNLQNASLRRYWSSLLPFGTFALGALYFAVMSFRSGQGLQAACLSVMSTLAGIQLLAEVGRGLTQYTYPMHDIRLIVIMACSALFGLVLSLYVVRLFEYRPVWRWMAAVLVVIAFAIILPSGLDTKASLSLLGPTIFSSVLGFYAAMRRKPLGLTIGGGLAGFALINFIGAGLFLDYFFYYAVAVLMLFLFAQQARAYAREQNLRIEEQTRADKLEFVLSERQTEPEPFRLRVTEHGRITQISASDIAYVSGAGDYVELSLNSGQTYLHSDTLAQLSNALPPYFLKVHRSYIVNTKLIDRLERDPSGTGQLFLSNDQSVPVSRRIMPAVRDALL